MFNSETIEVAIGMTFLFLLMSLICTALKEWLEGIFKWRAMDLERALRTLLDDKDGLFTADLFKHPMISSLFQGRYDAAQLRSSWMTPGEDARHVRISSRRNLPSYIPAANFATAFLDVVARGPMCDGGDEDASTGPAMSVATLRERAAKLESVYLRRAVLMAIDHSGDNLQRLTLNIQRWFDGSMDRASGWYKRRTQSILFGLGLAAAIVLNVDALHVMQRLTADKTFREVVVSAAAKVEGPTGTDTRAPSQRIEDARKQIQELGMPVGWKHPSAPWFLPMAPRQMCAVLEGSRCEVEQDGLGFFMGLAHALVGWLVTALAVMLGAPFWFDVLNRFMVIRSTVKPHEKSPEEGSEDSGGKPGAAAAGQQV